MYDKCYDNMHAEMYDKINYVHGFEEDKEFCVYAEGKDSCVVSFFFTKNDFSFLN